MGEKWAIVEYPAEHEQEILEIMDGADYTPNYDSKVEFGIAKINRMEFVLNSGVEPDKEGE